MAGDKWSICRACKYWSVENHRPKCKAVNFLIDQLPACPEKYWGAPSADASLPPAEQSLKAKAKAGWQKKLPAFIRAQHFVAEAKQFGEAVYSRLSVGPVPPEIVAERMAACQACPVRTERESGGQMRSFCGACGCGANQLARLDLNDTWTKLHAPAFECPLENFGKYEPSTPTEEPS